MIIFKRRFFFLLKETKRALIGELLERERERERESEK